MIVLSWLLYKALVEEKTYETRRFGIAVGGMSFTGEKYPFMKLYKDKNWMIYWINWDIVCT